ncbi:MAG: glycosyltransferase N-terminal domain-containing protein [Ferruginibacter sp.]
MYSFGIRVISAWNPKAKKWLTGRKQIFSKINAQLPAVGSKPVWMHCASLGEFEQGRPLLEQIKALNPQQKIVLTFFSPSGYEVMKDYTGADHIFYLPMDSAKNAQQFLDAVNPSLVLWVKYEYWYYYLTELKARQITTLLISGIFRKSQPFFSWYGDIWRKMLDCFTHFFVQNSMSKDLLAKLGVTKNVDIIGDTRFDRVLEIAEAYIPVPKIDSFCGDSQVLVAGSTWEEDEFELLHFVKANRHIKFIIAPHEINKVNLQDVMEEFPNAVFYSDWIAQDASIVNDQQVLPNVLIIDNMGMLSRIYRYATVAFIGGGFGADGVHNVLEAAVYGKPVVFGPVYDKFEEAIGLINAGGAKTVDGPISLDKALNSLFQHENERKSMGAQAKDYVYKHAGASKKIIGFIQENRLLTS